METFESRLDSLKSLTTEQRLSVLVDTFVLCTVSERNQVALELIAIALGSSVDARPRKSGLFTRFTGSEPRRDSHAAVADRALSELACRWSLLDEKLRHSTVSLAAGRWAEALANVTPEYPDIARRSAIQLAEDCPEPGLAGVCARLLSDPEVSIAAAAGRALVAIAQAAGPSAASSAASIEPEVLHSMLEIGVHRCRGAAVAAMVLLTPLSVRGSGGLPGPLASWFLGEETEPHSALRKALRADRSAVSRERAWEWLKLARFAAASGERLKALRADRSAVSRERAWEWLKLARFAAASGERLKALRDLAEFEAFLRRWHLLASPARRREWRSLRAAGRAVTLPNEQSFARLSPASRRGLIALREAQGDGAEARAATIIAMLHDDEPWLRSAAARTAGPNELIDLCFDADARVACSATLAWSVVGELGHDGRLIARVGARTTPPRRRWLGKLARSPHARVRFIARDEQRSTDWLDPSCAGGRATAWAMLRSDRAGVLAQLRELIGSGDDESRTRAIVVARRLNLTAECEAALVAIVQDRPKTAQSVSLRVETASLDPNPRLLWRGRARATAVMALGELSSVHAMEALRASVSDDEPRVRANAVEALGRGLVTLSASNAPLAALTRDVIVELKRDDEHRARANALRALFAAARMGVAPATGPGGVGGVGGVGGLIELKPSVLGERESLEDVLAMLGDVRVMHRLAGTWLSARLVWGHSPSGAWTRLSDLTARLGELARGDADARVRARAGRCVAGLRSIDQTARTDQAQGERGE